MKNKKVFEQHLQESALIRYEINEKLRKENLNILKKIFLKFFKRRSEDFNIVKDALYYKGGYPLPKSPPKMNEALDNAAAIFLFYDLMNNPEAINYMKSQHNISIIISSPIKDSIITKRTTDKDAARLIPEIGFTHAGKETLTYKKLSEIIFREALKVQSMICKLSDKIKYDAANAVLQECEVPKSGFKRTVLLKYKSMKQKDGNVNEDIVKIKKENDLIKEAVGSVEKRDDSGNLLNSERNKKINKIKIIHNNK